MNHYYNEIYTEIFNHNNQLYYLQKDIRSHISHLGNENLPESHKKVRELLVEMKVVIKESILLMTNTNNHPAPNLSSSNYPTPTIVPVPYWVVIYTEIYKIGNRMYSLYKDLNDYIFALRSENMPESQEHDQARKLLLEMKQNIDNAIALLPPE